LDSLDRVGLIISPALLNTLSLAAELAGAVNNFRTSGLRPLKRLSLNTCSPCPAMPLSETNKVKVIVSEVDVSDAGFSDHHLLTTVICTQLPRPDLIHFAFRKVRSVDPAEFAARLRRSDVYVKNASQSE
jgi:hypothetical protein